MTEREPNRAPSNRVVHLAGRVTESVFGFLGPVTAALAARGMQQTVVLFDDPRDRHLLPRFHGSVQLVTVAAAVGTILGWRRALAAFHGALSKGPVYAVHLHGILPCLLGAAVSRGAVEPAAVFFSPHGSKALGALRWLGKLLLRVGRPLSGVRAQSTLANTRYEAMALERLASQPIRLLEGPMDEDLFKLRRQEYAMPLVVAGGVECHADDAALVARVAILMGAEEASVSFVWCGTVDAESASRLRAAGVKFSEAACTAERASLLASAWVYLAVSLGRGFPHGLAEAMALGLPCVAVDVPGARDLLRDGETGYLCRTVEHTVRRLALLVDSANLRLSLGRAARDDARQRFGVARFSNALYRAYRIDAVEAADEEDRRA